MYLIIYVSRDVEQADAILKVWLEAGIGGVTILESAGMQQLGGHHLRDDLSIMPTLAALLRGTEIHHRTLMTAIKEEALLNRVTQATTDYIEDWTSPDKGIMLVLPVLQAFGLEKGISKQRK